MVIVKAVPAIDSLEGYSERLRYRSSLFEIQFIHYYLNLIPIPFLN